MNSASFKDSILQLKQSLRGQRATVGEINNEYLF